MINEICVRTLWRWKAKSLFGFCGKGTYCIRPLRVINGKDVSVGDNVSILHFLRLETYRVDTQSSGPIVTIEEGCNIEQSVHITAGKRITIGKNCSILAGSVITDINHPYSDIKLPSSKQPINCAPVIIGDECFIGTHAMIMPGVILGRHVIVGANSVVTQSFPNNCVIAGVPARMIKRYDDDTHTWRRCKDNLQEGIS